MTTTNLYAPPGAAVADVAAVDAAAEHAERGTRLVAVILDGIIFAAMVYLPMFLAIGFAADEGGQVVAIAAGIVTLIGVIAWGWLTYKYVAENGQSIAKKLLHIKVVRRDGSRASVSRIFWLRNIVNGLLGIIPLYAVIDGLFIFGESRQCVHDKLADTIVIKD
jgi:uncharacterized RDD family membrane protein YckC